MPLDNGIWRYTEGESASPTFSELLNRLGDSVRDRFASRVGSYVPEAGRCAATGMFVRARGSQVYLDGALTITAAGATAIAPGGNLVLATVDIAPAATGVQCVVPLSRGVTGPGYATLSIAAGTGIVSLLNHSGTTLTLASGNLVRTSLSYLAD